MLNFLPFTCFKKAATKAGLLGKARCGYFLKLVYISRIQRCGEKFTLHLGSVLYIIRLVDIAAHQMPVQHFALEPIPERLLFIRRQHFCGRGQRLIDRQAWKRAARHKIEPVDFTAIAPGRLIAKQIPRMHAHARGRTRVDIDRLRFMALQGFHHQFKRLALTAEHGARSRAAFLRAGNRRNEMVLMRPSEIAAYAG